jgi:23S rRNA (cytosine1962-C5)-methyltransferase
MDFISNHEGELPYELIIVDPPAFAKSMKKRHNAIQAYKRLNAAVFKKAKSGTIVLTFSCSQVVDVPLFKGAIVSAGIEAGRPVRIMKQLSQGADHPINLFHPEGHYLKGFMLYVE